MKKILLATLLLLNTTISNAANTVGYVQIRDLKAFSSYLSIYLQDDQTHNCAGKSTKFRSNTSNSHHTSFLLAAFAANIGVNLKYSCSDRGAIVDGIRLRSDS